MKIIYKGIICEDGFTEGINQYFATGQIYPIPIYTKSKRRTIGKRNYTKKDYLSHGALGCIRYFEGEYIHCIKYQNENVIEKLTSNVCYGLNFKKVDNTNRGKTVSWTRIEKEGDTNA